MVGGHGKIGASRGHKTSASLSVCCANVETRVWIPGTHTKAVWVWQPAYNPSMEKADIPRAGWQAIPEQLGISVFSERPCLDI